jgi:hypothetical protein
LERTQNELVSLQRGRDLVATADLSSAISDFKHGLQCAQQAQQLLRQLGAQLGDVVFELEWAKGATMTTEHAISFALS